MSYIRKYRKGDKITSLDELSKQEFIYFFDRLIHNGWFMSWQYRLAQRYIRCGWLFYAVKKMTWGYDEREEENENG